MMALAGVELETLFSEPDALTTQPPPCAMLFPKSRKSNNSKTQIQNSYC